MKTATDRRAAIVAALRREAHELDCRIERTQDAAMANLLVGDWFHVYERVETLEAA